MGARVAEGAVVGQPVPQSEPRVTETEVGAGDERLQKLVHQRIVRLPAQHDQPAESRFVASSEVPVHGVCPLDGGDHDRLVEAEVVGGVGAGDHSHVPVVARVTAQFHAVQQATRCSDLHRTVDVRAERVAVRAAETGVEDLERLGRDVTDDDHLQVLQA